MLSIEKVYGRTGIDLLGERQSQYGGIGAATSSMEQVTAEEEEKPVLHLMSDPGASLL